MEKDESKHGGCVRFKLTVQLKELGATRAYVGDYHQHAADAKASAAAKFLADEEELLQLKPVSKKRLRQDEFVKESRGWTGRDEKDNVILGDLRGSNMAWNLPSQYWPAMGHYWKLSLENAYCRLARRLGFSRSNYLGSNNMGLGDCSALSWKPTRGHPASSSRRIVGRSSKKHETEFTPCTRCHC